ncbi:hypothetical protein MY1884_008106 [Beauveria asiatica]
MQETFSDVGLCDVVLFEMFMHVYISSLPLDMAPHPSCFPGLHLSAGMQPAYSWFLAPLTAVDTLARVRQGTWQLPVGMTTGLRAAGLVEGRSGKESKGLSGSLDQAPSWCDVASAGIKGVPPRRGMNGQMAGLMVLEMHGCSKKLGLDCFRVVLGSVRLTISPPRLNMVTWACFRLLEWLVA